MKLRGQMASGNADRLVRCDFRPYSPIHVYQVFRKAARADGLKDFHFHDCDHGATMALNAGLTATIVRAIPADAWLLPVSAPPAR